MPAVPSQRTWTVGELANAAELNANIRDHINFWRQPPMYMGYLLANVTLANDTWGTTGTDAISFGSGGSIIDSENGYSGTGGKYFAVRSGLYDIRAQAIFNTNVNGGRALKIERVTPGGTRTVVTESGAISSCSTDFAGITNNETTVKLGDHGYHLDAGDYLELYARQTSGGSLAILGNATERFTWFAMRWVALT